MPPSRCCTAHRNATEGAEEGAEKGEISMAWVASHQPNRSVLMAWLGWSCEPVDLANNVTPPYIQTIHKHVT